MTLHKNKKSAALAIITILASLGFGIFSANASVGQPIGPDCVEAINPYNAPPEGHYAPEGSDTSPYVNEPFSESTCKTHAPYAGPHIAVDANTHNTTDAAKSEKIHGPWTDHFHSFHNNSIQDSFIYKTYMAAFEITVQSDASGTNGASKNTDTTLMECPVFAGQPGSNSNGTTVSGTIADDFRKCKNGAYDPDHFGGIHLSRSNVGSTIVLRWDFGWNTSSGKPWTPGKNQSVDDGDNPEIFPFDTNYPFSTEYPFDPLDYRSFHMGVRLRSVDTINQTIKAWSGTTTSRTLVKDAALAMSNKNSFNSGSCPVPGDVDDPSNGWCALEPSNTSFYPSLPGTVGHPINSTGTSSLNYYWVNIGTVATVWERTSTPPATCSTLSLDINQNGGTVLPANVVENTGMTLTVKPTFDPNTKTRDLFYKWRAVNAPTSNFRDDVVGNANQGTTFLDSLNDTKVYYTGGPGGTIVYVDAFYDSAATQPSGCKQQLTIPTPPPVTCHELKLDITQNGQPVLPANVVPNTEMTLKVTPTFDPTNQTKNLYYKWQAINAPSSNFKDDVAGNAPQGTTFTDSVNDTQVYYSGGPGGTVVNVNAFYDQAATQPASSCHQTLTIPTTPPPNCLNLNPTANGADMVNNSFSLNGGTTVTLGGTPVDTNNASIPQITWSETGPGIYTTNATNQAAWNCSTPPPVNNQTFSADYRCKYIYHADPNGQGSASFQANPNTGDVAACKANVTVTTQPQRPKCLSINILENSLNTPGETNLNANVTYTDGNSYLTGVTWTQTNGGLTTYNDSHLSNLPFQNKYTTANNSGSVHVFVSSVPASVDNSETCQTGDSASNQPVNPSCLNLDLQPPQLNANGSTPLTAHVTFTDGNDYNTTVQWTGSNGTYNNGQNTETKTDTSSNLFQNTFTVSNPDNQAIAYAAVTAIPGHPDWSLGNCSQAKRVETPPHEDKCEDLHVFRFPNNQWCAISNTYNGDFTWNIGGRTTTTDLCVYIPPDTIWNVFATDEANNNLCQDKGTTPPSPPTLEKWVSRDMSNNSGWTSVLTVAAREIAVKYQIRFTPTSPNTSATIYDPIWDRGIQGYTYGDNGKVEKGMITYGRMISIEEGGATLRACNDLDLQEDETPQHCYNGPFNGRLELVKVSRPVTITYSGKIENPLTNQDCENNICQQKFTNDTYADWWIYDSEGNEISRFNEQLHDFATVQIFCQYILTRAAGDIYLETDLTAGVDIRKCSKYTNASDLIVVPAPPETPLVPSTGAGEAKIFTVNHEICTEGQAGTLDPSLKDFYGQTVSKLSSQICEVKLQPGTAWQQESITNNIEENKTRISRWDADNLSIPNKDITINQLLGVAGTKEVYHIKDASLVIGDDNMPYTLSDGEGAKTFIVENGDLVIKQDIKYGACPPGKVCTVSDTASLAFIVLNGNVIVSNNVKEISGVYFVQEDSSKTGTARKGQLVSATPDILSYDQLAIYGSVYGDINPLFSARVYAGDPALGGAGIVVRFDERVMLNTPPGLRDVLNFSQSEVAR